MKLLPTLLLAAALSSAAAEPPVQLNGWYPCTQSSLQSDTTNMGHPDQYYLETASYSSPTRRRATASVAQAPASSLPFLQQSFDRLFARHGDWKQQEQEQAAPEQNAPGIHQRKQHGGRHKGHGSQSSPQYECGEFRVPMCYDGVCTSDNTIDVFVKRVKATATPSGGKNKALWVLQGGPEPRPLAWKDS